MLRLVTGDGLLEQVRQLREEAQLIQISLERVQFLDLFPLELQCAVDLLVRTVDVRQVLLQVRKLRVNLSHVALDLCAGVRWKQPYVLDDICG